jgi:hypothetical protein
MEARQRGLGIAFNQWNTTDGPGQYVRFVFVPWGSFPGRAGAGAGASFREETRLARYL